MAATSGRNADRLLPPTETVERGDERRDRAVAGSGGAVARPPVRAQLEPARALLAERDAPEIGRAALARQDGAAFREHVLRAARELGVLLHEPARAVPPARLLVGHREEDHVALERLRAPRDLDEREEVHDRDALRVERAAPHHVAARRHAVERPDRPLGGLRRHDVEMGEQDDRALRARYRGRAPTRRRARSAEPSDGVATTRASIPSPRSSPTRYSASGRSSPGGFTVLNSIARVRTRAATTGSSPRKSPDRLAPSGQARAAEGHRERERGHTRKDPDGRAKGAVGSVDR